MYEYQSRLRIVMHFNESSTDLLYPWWACPEQVRTWIQDSNEYFRIPEEIVELLHGTSVPATAQAA